MRVIKLTTAGGRAVYINPEFITTMMPDGTGTMFFLAGGDTQRVSESIELVITTLEGAYNG